MNGTQVLHHREPGRPPSESVIGCRPSLGVHNSADISAQGSSGASLQKSGELGAVSSCHSFIETEGWVPRQVNGISNICKCLSAYPRERL